MTTPESIAEWRSAPEGRQLEFKTASTSFHFEKLVDYCVALANEGGGKIILGITDRRPRDVVGTAAFADPGRTEAGLYERLRHHIRIEETRYQEKRLLIVHVPGRLPGTAWEHNGRYLRRAGDDLVSLPPNEPRAIFAETGPDYSAEPCAATLADLAPQALADFRQRWVRKAANPRIADWSVEQMLKDAELLVDDRLNIAAL